jgi:uncharacterized protein
MGVLMEYGRLLSPRQKMCSCSGELKKWPLPTHIFTYEAIFSARPSEMQVSVEKRDEKREYFTMSETIQVATEAHEIIDTEIQTKYDHLQAILREMESVLVAYSGGVDSALLLKVAYDVLGERALGVIATSPVYAQEETDEAIAVAHQLQLPLLTIETHELENERYAENSTNRCYFCKTELFSHLKPLAQKYQMRYITYGVNKDDDGDYRPGQQAAREFGVREPLKEAGMGKREIRAIARMLGMSVWD